MLAYLALPCSVSIYLCSKQKCQKPTEAWMSLYKGSYRVDGAYGQITTIIPEKGLVVSIQCPENGHFERVRKAIHEEFLMLL